MGFGKRAEHPHPIFLKNGHVSLPYFFSLLTAEWKAVGCYKNSVRALDKILKANGRSISSRYAACISEADGSGITLFGMDDKRCWIGEDAHSAYDTYGNSGLCKTTKKGINYGLSADDTMRVYMKDVEGNNPKAFL